MVECQLPKLDVGGSNPLARYKPLPDKPLSQADQLRFLSHNGGRRAPLGRHVSLFVPMDPSEPPAARL